jgi:death-on-curing protein
MKAAALVDSVARNHGFADGNKRTALILVHTLLAKSGYRLASADGDHSLNEAAEAMVLAVVTHTMSFDAVVAWFEARIRRL